MSMHFNNEMAMVVSYTIISVTAILFMWWIIVMEGARYRQRNSVEIKKATAEYMRKKAEKRARIKKEKRLKYIEERQAKRRKNNDAV